MTQKVECEDPELFDKLGDIQVFRQFIKDQYLISFSGSRLRPLISDYNLTEAFASYQKDLKELRDKENDKAPLEQVKQAAFLAYWLRRVSPIHALPTSLDVINSMSERESFLAKYANEFCAFDLAYRICRYVESQKLENVDRYVRSSKLDESSPNGETDVREHMLQDLRAYVVPHKFIVDACQCMKEKNVSPHAIYLILKGLFLRLQA